MVLKLRLLSLKCRSPTTTKFKLSCRCRVADSNQMGTLGSPPHVVVALQTSSGNCTKSRRRGLREIRSTGAQSGVSTVPSQAASVFFQPGQEDSGEEKTRTRLFTGHDDVGERCQCHIMTARPQPRAAISSGGGLGDDVDSILTVRRPCPIIGSLGTASPGRLWWCFQGSWLVVKLRHEFLPSPDWGKLFLSPYLRLLLIFSNIFSTRHNSSGDSSRRSLRNPQS